MLVCRDVAGQSMSGFGLQGSPKTPKTLKTPKLKRGKSLSTAASGATRSVMM